MEGSVGNTAPATRTNLQGIHVPIPWEHIDWAPDQGDCRAASNPAPGEQQVTCAGDKPHTHLSQHNTTLLGKFSDKSARDTTLVHFEHTQDSGFTRSNSFDHFTPAASDHDPLLGAPGPEVISIQGGGKPRAQEKTTAKHLGKMESSYSLNYRMHTPEPHYVSG